MKTAILVSVLVLTCSALGQKHLAEWKIGENSFFRGGTTALLRCVHGPYYFRVGGGAFYGGPDARLCVPSNSPIHLSQIVTGDVWIWSDDGHVWPIVSPDRREWWEKEGRGGLNWQGVSY